MFYDKSPLYTKPSLALASPPSRFLLFFFINNGAIFADIMESRNIITAREMVYDHNWLVPTMNGELRLEKPPLPTWIAAITEMISPDNLPLQRAMAGFAAVMLVLFFYKFATKLNRQPNLCPGIFARLMYFV